MKNQDFTTTMLVDQTPRQIFDAINHVRGWWSENIAGSTDQLNSEFDYAYKDIHAARIRIVELVPEKKVVWQVKENYFKHMPETSEWVDTKMIFEIAKKGNQTEIRFTHEGLVPAYECYEVCNQAWTHFVLESLRGLITEGKGQPTPKEGESFNSKLVREFKIDA